MLGLDDGIMLQGVYAGGTLFRKVEIFQIQLAKAGGFCKGMRESRFSCAVHTENRNAANKIRF